MFMSTFRVLNDLKHNSLTEKQVEKKLLKGQSIREALDLSNDEMLGFYAYAEELFKQKKFEEASDVLFLLATLDSQLPVYWLALGIAERARGAYLESCSAFNQFIALDPTNPTGYFEAIKTCLEIPDNGAALDYVSFLLAMVPPEYAKELETAGKLQEELKSK